MALSLNDYPVRYTKKSRPSGELLNERLLEERYDGPEIIFGRRNNKREALETFRANGIKIPRFTYDCPDYRAVGRPDFHSKGRWMYFKGDVQRRKHPATHWLEWIDVKREFRVHVVDGKSIKLSEKFPVGNFKEGESFFRYVDDCDFKSELRDLAKQAVEALEFEFGAVDIIYDGVHCYVLEVNSAPCLTTKSDTLERYVQAFCMRDQEVL